MLALLFIAISAPFGLRRFVACRYQKAGEWKALLFSNTTAQYNAATDPGKRNALRREMRQYGLAAEVDFRRSLEWNPTNLFSRYHLANIYTRLVSTTSDSGEIASACRRGTEQFEWFARHAPDFANIHFYQGQHFQIRYLQSRDPADRAGAVRELERAARTTTDPSRHIACANALRSMGEADRVASLQWRMVEIASHYKRFGENPALYENLLDQLQKRALVQNNAIALDRIRRFRAELESAPAIRK